MHIVGHAGLPQASLRQFVSFEVGDLGILKTVACGAGLFRMAGNFTNSCLFSTFIVVFWRSYGVSYAHSGWQ